MKICITAAGPSLDSEMDPRFGRCQYFVFVDSETLTFKAVENPSIGATGGAGIQSAQLVVNQGVEVVITGNVGPNAFTTLQAGGIKILTGATGKVLEVLDKFKKGQISSFAQTPTVKAHTGMGGGGGMGKGMGRGVSPSAPSSPTDPSRGEELAGLKEQSTQMKTQMDQIIQRIEKLERS